MNKNYYTHHPLSPSRENRGIPNQTEVVELIEGATPILSRDDVKEFIPVRHDQYNVTIDRLIRSVTEQVESYIRHDVVQKTIRSYWRLTPRKAILTRGPHSAVTSVTIDGDVLTGGEDYTVSGMKYKTVEGFKTTGETLIEYTSGYAPDKIPPQIPDAILQEISLQFKNRQDPDTPAMTSVHLLSLEARHLLSSLIRRAF